MSVVACRAPRATWAFRVRALAASASILVAWAIASAPAAAQRDDVEHASIDEVIDEALDGPTVDEVVRAALATPRLDPARTREAAERARLAGLLPQLRADLRRGQVLDLSALTGTSGDRSTWSSGDQLSIGAQVVFSLDRLAFAPEEPALLRERRHLEDRRLELVARVIGLYFERCRLRAEAARSGASSIADRLRISEIEALLDALTDGFFSSARRPSG